VANPDSDGALSSRKGLPAFCETRYHHDLISETVTFDGPQEDESWISQRSAPQASPRLAVIYYHDGEKFARVYIDHDKAKRFAERQKKSPIVARTRVTKLS
jgi:hypothetical protein